MSPAARANAATLEVTAGPIRGRDGFDVNVTVRLPIKLHDGPLDRAAFAKGVGEGRVVSESVEKIVKLIADPVQTAIASAAEGNADDLLAATNAYAAAAAEAARLPLFKLGLMPDGPATATADAPALRQRKAEQAAADASRAASDRADDLLRRFEDIRRQSPDVPPGRLLMALPTEDRREALMLLFKAAGEREPGRLFVAAGLSIFKLVDDRLYHVGNPSGLSAIRRLRRCGNDVELIAGGRFGVSTVFPEPRWHAIHHPIPPGRDSPRGFSGVAWYNPAAADLLWATHRDLGLYLWSERGLRATVPNDLLPNRILSSLDETVEGGGHQVKRLASMQPTAVAVADDFGGVAVIALDLHGPDDAAIAEGCGLFRATYAAEADEPYIALERLEMFERATVVSLDERPGGGVVGFLDDGRIISVTKLGEVASADERVNVTASVAPRLDAGSVVPWLGDVRVAACVEGGPVVVGGPDDDVRVEYRSEHSGFAAVAASGGRLAAVTGDRQRVVVWNLHEPDRPILDLYALADTRSRVADVAFL